MRITKSSLCVSNTCLVMVLAGCFTSVDDPNVSLSFKFSDGSAGKCNFKNARGTWSTGIPSMNVMIRLSDDDLTYDCITEDGREVTGAIQIEMDGEKNVIIGVPAIWRNTQR